MPHVLVRARTRIMWLGIPPYAVATVVSIWSPLSALVLYGIIDLLYMVPSEWLERLVVAELRRTAERTPDRETEEVDPGREPQ